MAEHNESAQVEFNDNLNSSLKIRTRRKVTTNKEQLTKKIDVISGKDVNEQVGLFI